MPWPQPWRVTSRPAGRSRNPPPCWTARLCRYPRGWRRNSPTTKRCTAGRYRHGPCPALSTLNVKSVMEHAPESVGTKGASGAPNSTVIGSGWLLRGQRNVDMVAIELPHPAGEPIHDNAGQEPKNVSGDCGEGTETACESNIGRLVSVLRDDQVMVAPARKFDGRWRGVVHFSVDPNRGAGRGGVHRDCFLASAG